MVSRPISLIGLCVLSTVVAQPAFACPVCFVAKKENLTAFLATGVLLSLLPLMLVGGIGLWLYRQAKARRGRARKAEMSHHSEGPPPYPEMSESERRC